MYMECSMDRFTDVTREYSKQVGDFELCHPYGCGWNSDHTRFTDCDYTSIHNILY